MAKRTKRTKRRSSRAARNPGGLGEPVSLAIGAATAAAALIPTISKLFSSSEQQTPAFHFDPNKYAQDYAQVLAAKTQQAVAQEQTKQQEIVAQAQVAQQQAKSSSTSRLILYGVIGLAVVVGGVIILRKMTR